MLFRKTVFILALVSSFIPNAFASSGTTFVGGELGYQSHYIQGNKSRADVQKEFLAFRNNPMAGDGGTLVSGEIGYIAPQHSYAIVGGKLLHTDSIDHNTQKPSLTMTVAERLLYKELYAN